MVTMLRMDTKYATLFLSAHQLYLHPPDLSLFRTFPLLLSITLFYYTCYHCVLFDIYYNNKKADKYRSSGTLSLLYILCFFCTLFLLYFISVVLCFCYTLFLLYFIDSAQAGVNINPFNSMCTVCKSSRIL